MLDFEAGKYFPGNQSETQSWRIGRELENKGNSHNNCMEAWLLQSWAGTFRQCKRITEQMRCFLGVFIFFLPMARLSLDSGVCGQKGGLS